MKRKITALFIFIIIISITLCSCSQKKQVDIYQNKAPTTRKPINAAIDATLAPDFVKSVVVEFDTDELIVSNTSNDNDSTVMSMTIPYDSIEEFEYPYDCDYANDTQIKLYNESESVISAQMQSENGEKYTVFAYKTHNKLISVYFMGQRVVFNLESNEKTKEAFETLKSKIK